MRILVTGGSGFIGQRLCRSLVARGHELWVLTRRPHAAAKLLSGSVVLVTSLDDIADNEKFDAVINLSGESVAGGRWTARRKKVLFESRVGVTEALQRLIARLESKPAVLINGSATGFYGDAGNAELNETSPAVKRDFTYLLCDAWEQAARAIGQQGVRVCILRIGVVLSHYGGMLGKLLPVYRMGLGAMMGDGRQWFSWIHLDDLIAIIIRCLDYSAAQGVYNAVAPQPVTYRKFHETLAAACRRPALLRVPALPLRLALGEMSSLMLGGQKVVPARLTQEGFEFRHADIASALRAEIG